MTIVLNWLDQEFLAKDVSEKIPRLGFRVSV